MEQCGQTMILKGRNGKNIEANVLRVAAVGDFGAQNCQFALKFIWKTELDLTTEPPIEVTRCYRAFFSLSV